MTGLPSPQSAEDTRQGWKVSRPRDGRFRSSRSRPRPLWLVPLALILVGLGAWLWPQPALQRLRYPLRFSQSLRQECRRTGLSPSLVAAVVMTESEFRAGATSPAGAQGLMQLMPDTAKWVQESLEGREGPIDLFQPELNLRLGTTYLGYLSQRFEGQEVAILAAYNAGPQQALKWMADGSGNYLALSDIGFRETRAYVEAVLQRERIYRQLYPELASARPQVSAR